MDIESGKRYRIRHTIPGSVSRWSVMTYLGMGQTEGELQFDARPTAGTQTIKEAWIVSIEPVDDSIEHYVNRAVKR